MYRGKENKGNSVWKQSCAPYGIHGTLTSAIDHAGYSKGRQRKGPRRICATCEAFFVVEEGQRRVCKDADRHGARSKTKQCGLPRAPWRTRWLLCLQSMSPCQPAAEPQLGYAPAALQPAGRQLAVCGGCKAARA